MLESMKLTMFVMLFNFEHSELINLKKAGGTISCFLDGKKTDVLWNTVAQVSILSKTFLQKYCPSIKINDISSLVGGPFNLKAANGSAIPY